MTSTVTVAFESSLATLYATGLEASRATVLTLDAPFVVGPTLPNIVPEDEAFFWTPEWQEGEAAAEADLAAGRTRRFATADDLIHDLLRARDDS